MSTFSLCTLLFRTLHSLCSNITFCALEFCVAHSYFSVHLLHVIFLGNLLKLKHIVCQYYFEVMISIYQQYDIFELFETKYENIYM